MFRQKGEKPWKHKTHREGRLWDRRCGEHRDEEGSQEPVLGHRFPCPDAKAEAQLQLRTWPSQVRGRGTAFRCRLYSSQSHVLRVLLCFKKLLRRKLGKENYVHHRIYFKVTRLLLRLRTVTEMFISEKVAGQSSNLSAQE